VEDIHGNETTRYWKMNNFLQGMVDGLASTFFAAGVYVLFGSWWLSALAAAIVWMLMLGSELLTYDLEGETK